MKAVNVQFAKQTTVTYDASNINIEVELFIIDTLKLYNSYRFACNTRVFTCIFVCQLMLLLDMLKLVK